MINLRIAALLLAIFASYPVATAQAEVIQYNGDGSDLQRVVDQAAEGDTVVCDASTTLTLRAPIVINKPLTLRRLTARLPEGLSRTALIEVKSSGVTLQDLELHGNYDSVSQDERRTLCWIARGDFRVERCHFFDGSKDGIMLTPELGKGDIVGGVIRDIEATRMGRDAVSISGGNKGALVRNVTVENVTLRKGYLRGAVEVSDGTENISVRHVRAKECVYAIDIQDHRGDSAPNVNVLFEDITAIDCRYIVRMANSPRGHANLILRNLKGVRCDWPVEVSHTQHVVIDGVRIEQHAAEAKPPVTLTGCQRVTVTGVTLLDSGYDGELIEATNCDSVETD